MQIDCGIITLLFIASYTACISAATNETLIGLVPAPISFECERLTQENTVYLYKNGIKVVMAKLENSTFKVDNTAFTAVSASNSSITFNLLKTALRDEGKYVCMTMENGTNIDGNEYSLQILSMKNYTRLAPAKVKFDCALAKAGATEGMKVSLHRNGVSIVTATRINSTFQYDNKRFDLLISEDSIIFELRETSLIDEGKYTCVIMNNGKDVFGYKYFLHMFAKPSIKTNVESVNIFGGVSFQLNCGANGKPAPNIQWIFKNKPITTTPSNIIKKASATLSDGGIYTCKATNKYGNSTKEIDVTVKNQFPGKPTLTLLSRTENSLTLFGEEPTYLGRGNQTKNLTLECLNCGSVFGDQKFTGSNFEREISGLSSLTVYKFELTACNQFVCGSKTIVEFETKERAMRNYTRLAPAEVEFDCALAKAGATEGMKVSLHRNGVSIVTATRINSTFQLDNEKFALLKFKESISFQLKKTSLIDEGKYTCVITNDGKDVFGYKYFLHMFAKPSIKTNVESVNIFGGVSFQLNCSANGKPAPNIQWIFKNKPITTTPSNIIKKAAATLSDGGIYTCKATNKYGNSAKDIAVTVKNHLPGKPTLTLQIRTENSLTLFGQEPTYLGRGNKIENLNLKCTNCGSVFKSRAIDGSNFTLVINLLTPVTFYDFELYACNPFACGHKTIKRFRTQERGKPTKPLRLVATAKTFSSIRITWTHGNHSQKIIHTNIEYFKTPDGSTKNVYQLKNHDNFYTIKKLDAYTVYEIYVVTCVQSQSQILCSDPSSSIKERTNMKAPSSPRQVEVSNTNDAQVAVIVRWHTPQFMNGPAVSYRVHYKIKDNGNWNSNDVPQPRNNRRFAREISYPKNYKLANLLAVTTYQIKVSAYNTEGSTDSDIKEIKTDESAPGKPLNVTLVKKTQTSLTIKWMVPQSSALPSSLLSKKIPIDCYFITLLTGATTEITVNSCNEKQLEKKIESLKANTTYLVTVHASVRRTRDNSSLYGEKTKTYFTTAVEGSVAGTSPPIVAKKGKTGLIVATVLSLLIIIAVIVSALVYCKKKDIFNSYGRSIFYVEEGKERPLASRLSMRSVERKQPAILVEDFPDHVARLHADSDYLFSEEYYSLGPSKPNFTWEHSTHNLNRPKNRYQDIVAYDHSRVRLMSIDGIPASNYINANFIDGFEKKPAYIATQAPLNHTIEDYWRMVWEQDVRVIVMLTNLMERGKRKCDQYWPHSGEIEYGPITVRTIEERKYAYYVHRVFSVKWNNASLAKSYGFDSEEVKDIRQFHFTDWPDFGVPQEGLAMLSFTHMVRRYMQETDSPTVVHCSAGVGRSGTFIVIETQIERINRKQNVNVYNFIKSIRTQRNFLVQQEVQYVFLHDALADYIKCGLTAIPVGELEAVLNNEDYFTPQGDTGMPVIEEEWQIINEFDIHEFEMLTGKRPCNQQKNRDSYIVPVDSSRVRLTMKGATEGTDYINANYMDGFHQKKRFIVTQMPLHDTIEDFWRMIWENFCEVVVSLLTDEECSKEDCLSYLPRSDCNPVNFGSFEIHCVSETDEGHYRLKELELVGRVEWGESERRKVFHYQFLDWNEDEEPNADHIYDMIKNIKIRKAFLDAFKSSPDSSPVVVHCSCGVGRSGVYCAMWNIKEQMDDFEETVDVFAIVRMMRRQRPLVIQSKAHYEYLYKAALRYKELMPTYPQEEEQPIIQKKESMPISPMQVSDEVKELIANMEEDSESESDENA